MWYVPVFTDRTILTYRPDRVLHDKKGKASLLTDTVTPGYSNVKTEETEKLSKYKNLDSEVSRMWEMRINLCQL